ncbi:MAG: fluoride efflux transporter CrcB [Rhodobacterales bacterium]|nr:fluoride efflux transporter CrcB [Rhodobacterales bacterium]
MILTMTLVALGGALGAALRYLTGLAVAFPFGTLTVNVAGSLAIGLLWVVLTARGLTHWQPFLITGILGGFTTFSAFSLDTLRLVEDGRTGMAGAYVLASVALSLGACIAGAQIARAVLA